MRFSLVVATLGRDGEVRELFASFAAQTHQDFEVIVIDQNSDDRLEWMQRSGEFAFPVQRIKSGVKRLSHARNLGLGSASGDLVAFPDDDCLYPPDLLARVDSAFSAEPRLGIRTGPVISPTGQLGSGRWHTRSGPITADTIWTSAISINIFMRLDLARSLGGFDERLGIGATWGSGEDTDLAWRAVISGYESWYDLEQKAIHPDKRLTPVAVRRAADYGSGCGYVLRKHAFPLRVVAPFMVRPLAGCVLSLARGRLMHAGYYWNTWRGRMRGFSGYRRENASSRTGKAAARLPAAEA